MSRCMFPLQPILPTRAGPLTQNRFTIYTYTIYIYVIYNNVIYVITNNTISFPYFIQSLGYTTSHVIKC